MRNLKALTSLLCLTILAVSGSRASAQANVIENQTSFLYVDAQLGSDSNSGAQSSPLKTIQVAINKANALNQQNIGVKVIVNAGVYREAVSIGNYKATSAPLTVQAAVAGTAVISGANVISGWTQQNATTYQAVWPYALGNCAIPAGWPTTYAPIVQRAEVVTVNGVPMTEVLSFNDMQPGTFYVNEGYQLIHIAPPAGTDMSTAVIEAAVRSSTLSVVGRSNVVLRGLVFNQAANCINTASATIVSSNNVLVDSVQASLNNWGGLGISGSINTTVQNSVASYNGGTGILGNQDQNALYNFNETDYNNWRGAQGAFYNWGMGGTKLFSMHGATVQNHFSYNNLAQGLWFDTDNKNITINNVTLSGNEEGALQIERDEGPVTVENSYLCSSGVGINVLTSPNMTIKNNVFYNNSGTNKYQAEIFLAGQPGGKIITDWQTGQTYDLFTTGMVLSGNTFEDGNAGQLGFGTYLSGSDWTSFTSTLNSSNNTWYDPTTSNAFKVVNGKIVNLTGWQSAVQNDYTSTWALPSTSPVTACTAPAPKLPDFAVITDAATYTMSKATAVATVHVNSYGMGAVKLRVSTLPAGVSATLSQNNFASGVATITFKATAKAVTQTVPVTLWSTSGSRVHSVTFYLQVSAS